MATGGTVVLETQQSRHDVTTDHCSRAGCDRPVTLFWTEQTTGTVLAYCAEDGTEAFNLVTRWLRVPDQRLIVEEHTIEVEKAAGRGLYDQPPRYRPVYDGDDRKTKR